MKKNNTDIIVLDNSQNTEEKISNNYRRDKDILHPEGKILLMDGSIIECYPQIGKPAATVETDAITLDTTSEYLSVKKRTDCLQKKASANAKDKEEQELFLKNSFFLLSMKDQILSDSRLFLTRVPIQSGLAYTGISGFRNATLGIYIEWWHNFKESNFTDESGIRYLVCKLSGSPLSGSNTCLVSTSEGKYTYAHLKYFLPAWASFMNINTRYTTAKENYQAYTLKEAIEILKTGKAS